MPSQSADHHAVTSVTERDALRAEARLLTTIGLILLGFGLPTTMVLAALAMSPDGLSPALPAAIGGVPVLLGYLACHAAATRLARAKALGQRD